MVPEIDMSRESSKRNMYYLANLKGNKAAYKRSKAVTDSILHEWVKPERFYRSLIKDKKFVKGIENPEKLMFEFYKIAGDMECVDYLDLDIMKFFTDEELWNLWRYLNIDIYVRMGSSSRFAKEIIPDAIPLLQNIVYTAQDVIDGKLDIAASLRFGHDNNIIPLLAMVGVDCADAVVSPEEAEKEWNLL